MPFPARYVDELINRLSVRYGVAFMRQYGDADPSVIKADWCDVLDGWESRPEDISWALDHLPDAPITALGFRSLLRLAPRVEPVALPGPKADPELVKRVTHEMDSAKKAAVDRQRTAAQKAIDGVLMRADKSGMTRAQRDFCAVCATALGPGDHLLDRLAAYGVTPVAEDS